MNTHPVAVRRLVLIVGALLAGCGAAPNAQVPDAPLAPSGPAAAFNRVTYSDTPSAYDSRVRVEVISDSTNVASYVSRLHASGVKVLMYQALVVKPSDPNGWGGCLKGGGPAGKGPLTYPPTWFLRGGTGSPLYTSVAGGFYYLDFGNAALQRACLSHAIGLAKAAGFDGVFWDGIATSLLWADLPSCSPAPPGTCATDASWQHAMISFLRSARSQLRPAGLLSVGNVVGGASPTGGGALWQRYGQELDGSMEEAFAYGQTDAPQGLPVWLGQLANIQWSERHQSLVLLNSYDRTEAGNVYGLGSMMLVANGRSSYDISDGDYGENPGTWYSEYRTALSLSDPSGYYYQRSDNGVYERDFGGPPGLGTGVVLVNPTGNSVAQFAIDQECDGTSRYSGSGLTGVHSVSMTPHSALILAESGFPDCTPSRRAVLPFVANAVGSSVLWLESDKSLPGVSSAAQGW